MELFRFKFWVCLGTIILKILEYFMTKNECTLTIILQHICGILSEGDILIFCAKWILLFMRYITKIKVKLKSCKNVSRCMKTRMFLEKEIHPMDIFHFFSTQNSLSNQLCNTFWFYELKRIEIFYWYSSWE